jgi:predicted alpha/beta-fold hydrolase
MTLAPPPSFAPPGWLVNAHLQSIVPSLRLRRPLVARRARQMLACAQTQIVECGAGVRLLGHYSSQVAAGRPPARDLAVLLHGWEGSADSLYVLSLGSHLFELGCDVYRLNFRDHGPSHHLNEEIFHSCRLDEVVGAVRAIQRALPQPRMTIAGFSLGGNFALRVAARAPAAGIALERAIAICPVLRPHSEFPTLDAYLSGYAIIGDRLAQLAVPSHILISLDDPIIPAKDLQDVARAAQLQIVAIPHGGHCGFMESFTRESWADRRVAEYMGLQKSG